MHCFNIIIICIFSKCLCGSQAPVVCVPRKRVAAVKLLSPGPGTAQMGLLIWGFQGWISQSESRRNNEIGGPQAGVQEGGFGSSGPTPGSASRAL